jgi:hypothetical protein
MVPANAEGILSGRMTALLGFKDSLIISRFASIIEENDALLHIND